MCVLELKEGLREETGLTHREAVLGSTVVRAAVARPVLSILSIQPPKNRNRISPEGRGSSVLFWDALCPGEDVFFVLFPDSPHAVDDKQTNVRDATVRR